jgi:DNA-binding beta-propeller fold protein YncE
MPSNRLPVAGALALLTSTAMTISVVAQSASSLASAEPTPARVPRLIAEEVTVLDGGTDPYRKPSDVVVSADGRRFIVDSGNSRIIVQDGDGAEITRWGSRGSGDSEFALEDGTGTYGGIAVAPTGDVYVADTFNQRIQVFDETGRWLRAWGDAGEGVGQLYRPLGIELAPDGGVWVSDYGTERISLFTPDGAFVREIGTGELHQPSYFDLGPGGLVVATDYLGDRIVVFDADGAVVNAWGGSGPRPGQFQHPYGVALDAAGRVWTSEYHAPRIQVFALDGTPLGFYLAPADAPVQLGQLGGIDVGPGETIAVADYSNDRVVVVRFADVDLPDELARPSPAP